MAVADRFYTGNPAELREQVDQYLREYRAPTRSVRAAVVPHAGLVYSGRCAASVFARIEIPRVVVILGPNHSGTLGTSSRASLWARGAFETPMGPVKIAQEFAEALEQSCLLTAHDPHAHQREHAIEVILPFLAALAPDVSIVPLLLAFDDWAECERLGRALAHLVRQWPDTVLLLASSDMTHYEPAKRAARKDRAALRAVRQLDGQELLRVCRRKRVSMCGRAAVAVTTVAARLLGAREGTVVDYRHSGAVTGDDRNVVAYAGVVIP